MLTLSLCFHLPNFWLKWKFWLWHPDGGRVHVCPWGSLAIPKWRKFSYQKLMLQICIYNEVIFKREMEPKRANVNASPNSPQILKNFCEGHSFSMWCLKYLGSVFVWSRHISSSVNFLLPDLLLNRNQLFLSQEIHLGSYQPWTLLVNFNSWPLLLVWSLFLLLISGDLSKSHIHWNITLISTLNHFLNTLAENCSLIETKMTNTALLSQSASEKAICSKTFFHFLSFLFAKLTAKE